MFPYYLLCIAVLLFLTLMWRYKSKMDQQNIRLLHMYLDAKLVEKLLAEVCDDKARSLEFLLSNVKSYYHLHSIILFDVANSFVAEGWFYEYGQAIVAGHITDNKGYILETLRSNNLAVIKDIDINMDRCNLYISYLNNDMQHLIIFVGPCNHWLEDKEIRYLTQQVRHIIDIAFSFYVAESHPTS